MADTKIEWATKVWNPIVGCSLASPGCTNCYAMKMAGRLEAMAVKPDGTGNHALNHYVGTTQRTKAGFVWTGKVNVAPDDQFTAPLRRRKPTDYFVNSMSDLFHPSVPDEAIDRVFAVMALASHHTFKILTKRADRMRAYFNETTGWRARIAEMLNGLKPSSLWNGNVYQGWQNLHGRPDGLPNVWLGVSVEDQARADERIPDLLATPAALHWLSMEPLLGPVDLTRIALYGSNGVVLDALTGLEYDDLGDRTVWSNSIGWAVVGGESGPGSRPMHPDWARSLRDQCADADVPFFFKQWGDWLPCEHRRNEQTGNWEPVAQDGTNRKWVFGPMQGHSHCFHKFEHRRDPEDQFCWRVGKKEASRFLDGVAYNEFPEVAHG